MGIRDRNYSVIHVRIKGHGKKKFGEEVKGLAGIQMVILTGGGLKLVVHTSFAAPRCHGNIRL